MYCKVCRGNLNFDLIFLLLVGRQLEDSGVLNESLRSRSNSWGLHMPLVCPDGAVVAYAWKRQLAGQAGASAVDRTRCAITTWMSLICSGFKANTGPIKL